MLTLNVRNVNEALPAALSRYRMDPDHVHTRQSRPGASSVNTTLEWDAPVCTTYRNPMERVLFSPERDANPFFHLFEAMWILAGRNDVSFLSQFLPGIKNYSDNGVSFNAPYGHRLRVKWGDQLQKAADLLCDDINTRRAVCSIWDPATDLGADSKDIPCNDLLVFRVREGALDLTVYNRSNDIIWGAYGANAVQFAFILEHVAAMVGVPPGKYHQISNSFHIYLTPQYSLLRDVSLATLQDPYEGDYDVPAITWMPMGDPLLVVRDLTVMFDLYDHQLDLAIGAYRTDWVNNVLMPAWRAFQCYKSAKANQDPAGMVHEATRAAKAIAAPDWALAISLWMIRRAA
jgi:thymidylate synthase